MPSEEKWDSYLSHIINYTLIDKAYAIFFLITNLMRIKTFPHNELSSSQCIYVERINDIVKSNMVEVRWTVIWWNLFETTKMKNYMKTVPVTMNLMWWNEGCNGWFKIQSHTGNPNSTLVALAQNKTIVMNIGKRSLQRKGDQQGLVEIAEIRTATTMYYVQIWSCHRKK